MSDTRLFDPISRLPRDHFDGTLKIFILSERLGFAFAGNPTNALRALEICQQKASAGLSVAAVLEIVVTEAASGDTDFIVMSTEPAPCLWKVTSATKVEESAGQLWIGDQTGFDVYQRCFHQLLEEWPAESRGSPDAWRSQMNDAMQCVMDSQQVPTVGDFLVPVSSEDGGLHYTAHARIRFYATSRQSGDGWYQTRAGTSQEGSCSVTMLTSSNRTIPAVGFHFFEPRLGVFFNPQTLPRPHVFHDADVDSFVAKVLELHAVHFQNFARFREK